MLIGVLAASVTIPREFTVNVATEDADPYAAALTPDNGKSTLNDPEDVIGLGNPETVIEVPTLVSPTDVTVPEPAKVHTNELPFHSNRVLGIDGAVIYVFVVGPVITGI